MNWFVASWRDVVFAARMLRKSPIFTLSVVLTLALGVGVNTAVFSVVNAFVLRPLPVSGADRLVVIATQVNSDPTLHGVSFPDLRDYRSASDSVFADIAGYSVGFLGMAPETSRPERVLVTWVTGNYFKLLALRPAFGRLIQDSEGGPGRTDAIVVLGYSTWQRRFGGDPDVVGKTLRLNGEPCTIVGVAPRGFSGTFAFSESELYLPVNWTGSGDLARREARTLHAIARLRPETTIARAQAVMTLVSERLARQFPESNAKVHTMVVPERLARPEEDQFRSNTVGAAIMLALTTLVLIVAAVNVTSLLLARAATRRRELAIRAALGAGRRRLVQQLLAESLVLAAAGGGAGILLGTWVAGLIGRIRLPGDLPVRLDFHPDGRVLAFAVGVASLTGLLVGLVPALRISGADLDQVLRQPREGSPGTRGHRLRGMLVAAQIAVCVVLLVAAGLFTRSLWEAERADLGFRPDGVLNIHMDVGQLGYTEARGRTFHDEVARRVRAIPGVQDLSFAFTVPLGYVRLTAAVEAEGGVDLTRDGLPAGKNVVSPHYFRTMGIEIVRGRTFSQSDDEHGTRVAVVNDRFADVLWPNRDPIGRRFRSADGPWIQVVGVTHTGKYRFLFEEPQSFFYVPAAQEYTGLRVLQVRTSVPPGTLAPTIERAILALEPNLPLYDVQSMTQALGGGLGFFPVRVGAAAAATFGLLAVALAIVGLYGVLSYLTGQRTREIGVRVAIGASRRDVVWLVLRDGLKIVVAGLVAGLAITLACARVVASLLFGVSGRDPLTLLSVVPILVVVSLLACAIPAWRAARVDPTTALRAE